MNAESTRRVDTKPFHPACAALLWSRKALRPAQDPLPHRPIAAGPAAI